MAGRARASLGALDGFVMVTVAGLALVHIIPHAVLAAGPIALAVSLVGFVGPGLVEHRLERAAQQTHNAALALALFGLALHELFDGVGLARAFYDPDSGTSVLAVAVVLHRLPIAITVWWLLRPLRGPLLAWSVLAALGAATVIGYVSGDAIAGAVDARWLGMLEALIAGSLLHVVVHRPSPLSAPDQDRRERRWAAGGALLGLGAVLVLGGDHHGNHEHDVIAAAVDFRDVFAALLARSAPYLLVAVGVAGALLALGPRRWRARPPPWIGSCDARGLDHALARGTLPAGALAFLVVAPQLGLDTVLVSLALLGPSLAITRVGAGALLGILVALAVGAWIARRGPAHVPPAGHPGGGIADLIDRLAPWMVLGVAVAAVTEPAGRSVAWDSLPPVAAVALLALLGLPVHLCAAGAVPLAAVLVAQGLSPGAALAFLLTGPIGSAATSGLVARERGAGAALGFGAAIVAGATALGVAADAFLPRGRGFDLYGAIADGPGPVEKACLAAFLLLVGLSVVRQGPRGFVGQVLSPHAHGGHDHGEHEHGAHDHHHGGRGHGHGEQDLDEHGHGHGDRDLGKHGHDRGERDRKHDHDHGERDPDNGDPDPAAPPRP